VSRVTRDCTAPPTITNLLSPFAAAAPRKTKNMFCPHTHKQTQKKKSFFLQPEADFRHSTLAKMLAEGCDGAGRLSSVNCGVSSDGIPSVFAESCSVPSPRTCTVIDRLFFCRPKHALHCRSFARSRNLGRPGFGS
jgi:hypothetical protein